MDRLKLCTECKIEKTFEEFNMKHSVSSGRQSKCRECQNKLAAKYYKEEFKYSVKTAMLNAARKRAKMKNIKFEIDMNVIDSLIEKQFNKCALSNMELDWKAKATKGKSGECPFNRASLDRIDVKQGYVESNIQLVCNAINIAKSSLSQEDFVMLCIAVANGPVAFKLRGLEAPTSEF